MSKAELLEVYRDLLRAHGEAPDQIEAQAAHWAKRPKREIWLAIRTRVTYLATEVR